MDLRPFLAAHLLSSCASSCFSCSFPSPSFPPPSLHFTLSRFVRLRFSFWRAAAVLSGVAHRNKSKRHHGVVTGPPWGFTRPEVRHQRDTCSTLTIIAAQASALSFFVRSLSYHFFSLSFPFSLSLSCPFRVHDSINVVNASILVFRRRVSVLES